LRLSAPSAGEKFPLISLIFAEESKSICVYLRHLREKNMPADFADFRIRFQVHLRLSALSAGKSIPLIPLIFAEKSKFICAYLRHLREKSMPADFADFRRRIQGYLRSSALPAGEKLPADLAGCRRGIQGYLRLSALICGRKIYR
jgi:hypothetical protein